MVLLDLRDVSKRFGGVPANDRVSLRVHSGEIVGLIGPNGSGKTTLFNSIVGHHDIDSGVIRFDGVDISGLRLQKIARLGILRTFQRTRIFRDMTCHENVCISLTHRGAYVWDLAWPLSRNSASRAREYLALVGLAACEDQLAGSLSFGQQRLLEIAMALIGDPKLLLLDEPTAGISPSAIAVLLDRLRYVSQTFSITMMVVEHNMPVIMKLTSRVYCMNRGNILAEGAPAEIQNDHRVLDAYLGVR